ncbi:hypothetical protein SO802_008953 [Lithocarpus litseifolius]|uniref:DUF4283 domain-containing protein n=1 Tax=Lithocarpus litseifolius TaxID=425828 RepID=A0AAW2DAP5_9ROSI
MKARVLSREEEAELTRSNKKVKDSYHANFSDHSGEDSPSKGDQSPWNGPKASFKDRLVGRMDCVDLGYGFFLNRFYAKEDLDFVLQKGPWFIGDNFLSLRPWEPFFKPSTASVSTIAVWVRLNELPIELYDRDVLRQIGEAIGRVLRIDTHTAMEAQGKYTRLCVQIDLNKPLVNTIVIGRFEQPVMYEVV